MLLREQRSVGPSQLNVHLILVIDASESRRGATVSKRSHGSRFTKLNYIWSPRLEIQPWHGGAGDEEPDIAHDFNFALAGSTSRSLVDWPALADFSAPMGNSRTSSSAATLSIREWSVEKFSTAIERKLDSRSSPFFLFFTHFETRPEDPPSKRSRSFVVDTSLRCTCTAPSRRRIETDRRVERTTCPFSFSLLLSFPIEPFLLSYVRVSRGIHAWDVDEKSSR